MTKKLTLQNILIFGIAVLLTLSIAVTAVMLNVPTQAATENTTAAPSKYINVSGNSIISVVPDLAYISVGVISEDVDSKAALEKNNKSIQAVLDAIKSFKIDSKDIQTGSFSIYPRYNYIEKTGENVINGYTVNNTLTITVRNLDNLGKIFDTAVKAGANNSTNISFDYSKKSDKYLEALKLATENAKKEADAIASAFGGKNLTIIEVNENSSNYYVGYTGGRGYAVAEEADSSVPVEKGQIEISASVAVKYSFE
ncbi:MAG: hypothetical protein K0S55_1760 [Clostridia bacterium]|nr:hypothetical protein [Clostridia bacterium]